jgi:hypothetical protein
MDYIHLAVVNMVMNLQVPQNARTFLSNWGTVCFSRRTLLLGVRFNFCLVFPKVPFYFVFVLTFWFIFFPLACYVLVPVSLWNASLFAASCLHVLWSPHQPHLTSLVHAWGICILWNAVLAGNITTGYVGLSLSLHCDVTFTEWFSLTDLFVLCLSEF